MRGRQRTPSAFDDVVIVQRACSPPFPPGHGGEPTCRALSRMAQRNVRLSGSALWIVRPLPLTTLLVGASRAEALPADDPLGLLWRLGRRPRGPAGPATSRTTGGLGNLPVVLGHGVGLAVLARRAERQLPARQDFLVLAG